MKIITSKHILELLESNVVDKSLGQVGMQTKASIKVDSDELQDTRIAAHLKRGDKLPVKDVPITDFKYDPLGGTCSWYEFYNDENSMMYLNYIDVDFWMYGYSYQSYTSHPGIYLTIKSGVSPSYGSGVRYDPNNAVTYLYAPSSRSRIAPTFQAFSTLCNQARLHGLEGVEFPDNWDKIPYVV